MRSAERLNDIVNSLNTNVVDPRVYAVLQSAMAHIMGGETVCPGCAHNVAIVWQLDPSDHVRGLAKDIMDVSNAICLKILGAPIH